MKRYRQTSLTLFLLFAVPCLDAQGSIGTALGTLRAGQTVRVRAGGGDAVESRVLAVRAASLTLRLAGGDTAVAGSSIDSLWVRGNVAATGALVGGAVAGAVSFAFWASFCAGVSEGAGCNDWDIVTAYSFAGAACGALLGAAIGAGTTKWRLHYARVPAVRPTIVPLRHDGLGLGLAHAVRW